jgi:Uma2 family endonuclease
MAVGDSSFVGECTMPLAKSALAPGPKPYLYTVADYDRMAGAGLFDRKRVELVEGRIFQMAAQYEPHVAGISLTARAVERAFGPGYWVRRQSPIKLGNWSKPEPDVAVVFGTEYDYLKRGTPTQPLLVIEISDTTLRFDRGRKAAMYAKHAVSDYWILNIPEFQLEVHRNPVADPVHKNQYRYTSLTILKSGESVSPLAAAHSRIAVSEIMPGHPGSAATTTTNEVQ